MTLFLVACASMSPTHEQGKQQFDSGDFETANSTLETARAETPDKVSLLILLANTKYQLAQANFETSNRYQKYDIPSKLTKLTLAQQQIGAGVDYLHSVEKKINDDEDLAKEANIPEKESLLAQIQNSISDLNKDQENALAKALKLKGEITTTKNPEKIFVEFQSITSYQPYYKDIDDASTTIHEVFYKFLEKNAWGNLNNTTLSNELRSKYSLVYFQKMQKYSTDNSPIFNEGKEGLLAITAFESINQKNWPQSYSTLKDINSTL